MSNRLGNTFVDSSTCSNLNDLDTGIYNVNNYDGKITNVPFPGGSFMCVVAKQGDLYKYLLASVEGSLATKSLINGSWSSWAYYALKSDLTKYDIKTITVDVTTQNANSNGKYYTEKKLSTESWYSSAKAIVPLFARKSGGAYLCMVEIEYETLRVQADIAISGVTVGILVVS